MTDNDPDQTIQELLQHSNQPINELIKLVTTTVEQLRSETQRRFHYAVSIGGAVLAIISTLAIFAWNIICMKIDSRILAERHVEMIRIDERITSSSESLRREIERQIDLLAKLGSESDGRRMSARKNRRSAY